MLYLGNLGVFMNKLNYNSNLISMVLKHCEDTTLVETLIPHLHLYSTSEKSEFISVIYEPSLCIALQGEKEINYGDDTYYYSPDRYFITCTNIPAKIKIKTASKEVPYVAVVLRFSINDIYEVLKELDKNEIKSKKVEMPLCFNKLDDNLLEPLNRLVRLLDKPKKTIDFMYPLIIKEIIYILLENDKEFFKNYVLEGSLTNQIVKAISEIKNNYQETINMKELSKKIGISESTLYQNFKKITLMSPLQYQKKIRLEEAKYMLINQNIDASQVAFQVGYESPSQFSREYSRMFGMPPKAHMNKLKVNV
jgi:AraC-like DNA-binding protein